MAQEKGTMGTFSVVGAVEGIETVEGKNYSFVLFSTKSNERGKIPHRMFTGCPYIHDLSKGDFVEFYIKLSASIYQGKTYYNPEVKSFYIIKKAERQEHKDYVEVEDNSGKDGIPF